MGVGASGVPSGLPLLFAGLVGLAVGLVWLAFAPARPLRGVKGRLEEYLDRSEVVAGADLSRPFASRVLLPAARGLLRALGRLAGRRGLETVEERLVQAGRPLGLTALDFYGLRLLCALVLAGAFFFLLGGNPTMDTLLRVLIAFLLGYLFPSYWLRLRVRRRQNEVRRALPDALDMLTVGVEAGLAFESALLKVGEQWDNALTREFRRAVAEMRVGTARDEALWRTVERTGVQELRTFVAVLVQSSQLGVSIAEVLHTQADQMRIRRRQRAEELARQAGVKMIFPLGLLIFPALLIVILGPAIPVIGGLFGVMGGAAGAF